MMITIIITKDPLPYAWKMLHKVYINMGVNVYMYVFKYTSWVLRVANKQIIQYNIICLDIQFTFSHRGFHNLYGIVFFSCFLVSQTSSLSQYNERRIAGWTCFLLSILELHSPQPSTLNQQNLSNCYSNFLQWKKKQANKTSATFPLYWFFTNVSLCLSKWFPNSLQLGNSTSPIVNRESTCCNISAFCISSAARDLPTTGVRTGTGGWIFLVNGLEEILLCKKQCRKV